MTSKTLHKSEIKVTSLSDKIEAFLNRHAFFFICVCLVILFALLTALAYAIVGVSATDSGVLYNHLEDII